MSKFYFFPAGKQQLPIGKLTFGPGSVVELSDGDAQKIIEGIPGQTVEENGKPRLLPCLLPAPEDARISAVPVVVDKPILRTLPKPEDIGKIGNPQPPGHILAGPPPATPAEAGPDDGEVIEPATAASPRARRTKATATPEG